MSNRSLQDVLPTRSTTNTQTFLGTCVLNADLKALERHLVSNQVQQIDLDSCLLRGLQIVQWKDRELSHVAPALTLLLQSGAKWNSDVLLDDQTTPYHIICESPGDHHELLDLVIKSSQHTMINTEDISRCTALMCAVQYANINCIQSLIDNGADVYIGYDRYYSFASGDHHSFTPIMEAIWMLTYDSKYSSVIISDIFDLLLDAAVEQDNDHLRSCTNYIPCAVLARNVHCIDRLIKMGAPLDVIVYPNQYVWALVAGIGDVELLKSMFNRGINKNSKDQNGLSILGHTVDSGKIEAVRYLLDLGVNMPTYLPEVPETQCEQCKEDRLIIENNKRDYLDPCMRAIRSDKLMIVKLLNERGNQSCKSLKALRCAVLYNRVDIVSYLLNKYTYPLNREYLVKHSGDSILTLLTEPFSEYRPQIIKLLLNHAVDPAKPLCAATSVNAIMTAIHYGYLDIIAQYIRCGVDINLKSRDSTNGNLVSPFEASVLHDRPYLSVMLLISGCSRKFKVNPKLKLEKLMKEWNVYDDVTPLKHRCRSVILNHLSPQADKKIEKLPLPQCLIKFLSIPELDKIVCEYNTAKDRSYSVSAIHIF